MIALLTAPGRYPRRMLLAALLLTAAAIAGASRLRFQAALDAMFPASDPAAQALVRVLDRFDSADELLVLATLRGDNDRPDPGRLLDFADRFARVATAPGNTDLVAGVVYRTEPGAMQFVQREMAPAGLYYLDDAQLAVARQRLSAAGMQDQLQRDRAMLAQPGPAAAALAKTFLQDPLSLHDFLLPRLSQANPMSMNTGALLSADGRALLIRVLGRRSPTDLTYADRLTDAMNQAMRDASPRGLRVVLTGAYPIAAISQRSIRRDAVESVVGSILLLAGLFILAYRRPMRLFCLAIAPVAVGATWGFGAYGLVRGDLSPIAGVIGGVLAGMGIDYSVLYLTRFESLRAEGVTAVEAVWQTSSEIGAAITAAFITSVAGFLAIGCSSVRALRDFAILGTLGLLGCFVAAVFILPALLVLLGGGGRPAFRFSLQPLLAWTAKHRGACIGGGLAVAALCVALSAVPGRALLESEQDLTVMHPRPNPALDAESEVARRFGVSSETMLIDLTAASDQELLALSYSVQRRLAAPAVRAAGIVGTYGLATWLPDPKTVTARTSAPSAGDADRVVADFQAALRAAGFSATAFEGYAAFLHRLAEPRQPPDLPVLRQYPALARDLLPRDPGRPEAVTLVFFRGDQENRIALDAAIDSVQDALHGIAGATLTGLPIISQHAEQAVGTELPRLLFIAAALVAAYLLLHFRDVARTCLSLLPACFGFAVLAAMARWGGVRLNMINLIALPLLIGIDVDYGIYLVSLARGGRTTPEQRATLLASGAHAVLICAASMIAGYASLVLTTVPAMRSLGLVVAAGVASCLIGALFVLCPLLLPAHRFLHSRLNYPRVKR
jgi:uncharacterized protein